MGKLLYMAPQNGQILPPQIFFYLCPNSCRNEADNYYLIDMHRIDFYGFLCRTKAYGRNGREFRETRIY